GIARHPTGRGEGTREHARQPETERPRLGRALPLLRSLDPLAVGERLLHGLEARERGPAVLRHRPAELRIGRLAAPRLAVGDRGVHDARDPSDGVRGPGRGAPRALLLLGGHVRVPVYTGVTQP